MKALTPDEALNISEKLDALFAKIDFASERVSIHIKVQLLEIEMRLEEMEARDRWLRTPTPGESR
jgi:hypothetical protein